MFYSLYWSYFYYIPPVRVWFQPNPHYQTAKHRFSNWSETSLVFHKTTKNRTFLIEDGFREWSVFWLASLDDQQQNKCYSLLRKNFFLFLSVTFLILVFLISSEVMDKGTRIFWMAKSKQYLNFADSQDWVWVVSLFLLVLQVK